MEMSVIRVLNAFQRLNVRSPDTRAQRPLHNPSIASSTDLLSARKELVCGEPRTSPWMADSEEAAAPTVGKEEVSGLALSAPLLLWTEDMVT